LDRFYAHIAEDGRKQSVREHLEGTARLAAEFAEAFSSREYGYLVGMTHDIGKCTEGFQKRLMGGPVVDHSSAGAMACLKADRFFSGLCVASHHGGMLDFGNIKVDTEADHTYMGRMRRFFSDASAEVPFPQLPATPKEPTFEGNDFARALWCRMLYSCLVDADFLDTERFMAPLVHERALSDDIPTLLGRLERFTEKWKNPTNRINQIRSRILEQCRQASNASQGIFSLTVPTGGGKTIASLAFALRHAVENGLKRVIYVIPYTSIIEQNAAVFREILGEQNVVEHHSEAIATRDEDFSTDGFSRAFATENWDAPIIVTTAVQFFESLFASKPSKCRKLHNIAGSVVVFDEAQMIPSAHLRPCVATIATLAAHFNVSAVLCTATQPSLDDLIGEYAPDVKVREICPQYEELFEELRRVVYQNAGRLSNEQLSKHILSHRQVLCIVNTRKKAQQLFAILSSEAQDGCYHLSTLMYPAHRQKTLETIKARLKQGKECLVISTSLIEAGVDVDFPTVYRELAGLDSVVQAAGRCNREGRRVLSESIVTVFEGDDTPPRLLGLNIGAAKESLQYSDDIGSPKAIARYFKALRSLLSDATDESLAVRHLEKGIAGCAFPVQTVAAEFHLISTATKTVYIPCKESRAMIEEIVRGAATRAAVRRAGRYAVNIYEHEYRALLAAGDIAEIDEESAYLVNEALYDPLLGLSMTAESGKAEFI